MPARTTTPAVVFLVAAAVWLTAPAQATAAGRQYEQLQRGYDLAYNLDYDEAVATLTRAIEADPTHPGGYRGIAAITWLQILFLRGGVLVDSYLSDSGGTARSAAGAPGGRSRPRNWPTGSRRISNGPSSCPRRRCAAPPTTPTRTTNWAPR